MKTRTSERRTRREEEEEEEEAGGTTVAAAGRGEQARRGTWWHYHFLYFLKTRLLKAINYISLLFVSGMTGTQVKDLGKMFFFLFLGLGILTDTGSFVRNNA